ncbi:MAG: hypothetical protein QM537_08960 [Candidatus Symbiobacter sp.]|nr:hypothetical protein [Candidatus Symbiobacter sp.]
MRKIFWGGMIGVLAILAGLAGWFHFYPVQPTSVLVEKKLQLGPEN